MRAGRFLLIDDHRAASDAMWPAKLVTKVLRLVMSLSSENLPVLIAVCGDASTAVVVLNSEGA